MTARLLPLLLLATLAGCGSAHEEGLSLAVSAQLVADGPVTEEADGVRLTRSDGAEVVLTKAFVSVTRLELLPCPEASWKRLLRALSPVGVAHAHGSENPRVLEAAYVLSLGAHRSEAHAFHPMAPPPGRYCEARLTLAPMDAHTHGLPEGEALEGHTVVLEGTLRPAGASEATPFRLEAGGTVEELLPLEGLPLSHEAPEASLLVRLAFDAWLEELSPGSEEAAQAALARVAASMSVQAHRPE